MRPKIIQEVTIEFEKAEWLFEAKWCQRRVGAAACILEGTILKIGDLKVKDDFFLPWPFAHNILILLGVPCRRLNFRGLGIGTALLNRIISEADQSGISLLWGSVTASDIAKTPYLLDWYQRMGFEVAHESKDPVIKAVATISMKLSAEAS